MSHAVNGRLLNIPERCRVAVKDDLVERAMPSSLHAPSCYSSCQSGTSRRTPGVACRSQWPRREEALATLVDEGCTHEQAYLIEGVGGPVVSYVMEVEDIDASQEAARSSRHPIDADHKRVMEQAVGEQLPSELLLDLRR